MCGRYSLATPDLHGIDDRFTFKGDGLDYRPRFNIAPSQEVLTVVKNGERRGEYMRWGLVPFWARDEKIGYKMINARDDRLMSSNVYKPLLVGNEERGTGISTIPVSDHRRRFLRVEEGR